MDTRQNLRGWRFGVAGITQSRAADLCGVTLRTYQRWEQRDCAPEPARRLLMAHATGFIPGVAGWDGWRFAEEVRDGERRWVLIGPDGECFGPADLRAWFFERQELHALRAEARAPKQYRLALDADG